MRELVLALSVSLLLAGCLSAQGPSQDEDEDQVPSENGIAPDPSLPLDVVPAPPPWSVGDWWVYEVAYASGETYETRFVVHAEDATSWSVTAEDRELMLRAAFNHHPNFSPVEKGSLAQWIHGQKVEDLRWPMENGTWSGKYREDEATWVTSFVPGLATAKGQVPGFTTEMSYPADGRVRAQHSWSPVTKWFTEYSWDFDGRPPVDVTYRLKDWGADHAGTFPLVEVVDRVHRPFPAFALPVGAEAAEQPGHEEPFKIEADGASLLWAVFAAAGGPGTFEYGLDYAEPPVDGLYAWRPTEAGSHFVWGEVPDAPVGDWKAVGVATAQVSASHFFEIYEARTTEGTL